MFLRVECLGKQYRQTSADVLHSITFTMQAGEILSFVGPSGAGKTTLLKCIAGLEQPDAGRITFATPPCKAHPAILVFQDFLLFPHLNIFENVAFGLKARRLPRAEIQRKVHEILDYFGILEKAEAYPAHLSAGQKQRAAIARAMVVEPALLLLDEPFANLDRSLKLQTARFIRETQKRFGVTTISVTHDLEEAFAMSDRLGLLLDGRLVQCGTAQELYHSPASPEAAAFLGPINTIPPSLARVLKLPPAPAPLLARPEALRLRQDTQGPALVQECIFAGHYWKYTVTAGGHTLVAYSQTNGMCPGDRVALSLASTLDLQEPSA